MASTTDERREIEALRWKISQLEDALEQERERDAARRDDLAILSKRLGVLLALADAVRAWDELQDAGAAHRLHNAYVQYYWGGERQP